MPAKSSFMSKTDINELCSQPEFHRNEDWEKEFLTQFPGAQLKLIQSQVQTGPDGWPYVFVSTREGIEPALHVIDWASREGVGLVVNPDKDLPDYVFTYGMLWNYRNTESFGVSTEAQEKHQKNLAEEISFKKGEQIFVGPPSLQSLPEAVCKILIEFFHQQELEDVRVAMIAKGTDSESSRFEFAISLESLGLPDAKEHEGILAAVSWFMPPNYSLVLISEKGLAPFYSLKGIADGSVQR